MWSPVVVLLLVAVSGVAEGVVRQHFVHTSDPQGFYPLSQQLNDLTAQVAALQAQLNASTRSVAFQAKSSSVLVNLGAYATVVYDRVYLNIGNAYDDHTGFFTAPVSGTYTFSVSCMAYSGYHLYLDIVANDVPGTSCFSARYVGDHSNLGTVVTIVHLTAGQRLWVRNRQHSAVSMTGGSWTLFSGFLVQVDL